MAKKTSRSHKPKSPKMLWMVVTSDKYELPICIKDSSRELAEWLGMRQADVVKKAERDEKALSGEIDTGRTVKYRIVRIHLD